MFTIGFGMFSEYSRRRVPSPPQKSTTFMGHSTFLGLASTASAPASRLLQEAAGEKGVRGRFDRGEGPPRPLYNFHQTVPAIGEVQHPEHREGVASGVSRAADRIVEAALPQLGLALRVLVDVSAVALEYLHHRQAGLERIREGGR